MEWNHWDIKCAHSSLNDIDKCSRCLGHEHSGCSTSLATWYCQSLNMLTVRRRHGKKEPPLRTVDEGLYWAVALGQNSRAGERGDKGSLRGMRGGERFYSQVRRLSQVFSYKEKSVGYSTAIAAVGVPGLRVGI